jgi:hypothetical protein
MSDGYRYPVHEYGCVFLKNPFFTFNSPTPFREEPKQRNRAFSICNRVALRYFLWVIIITILKQAREGSPSLPDPPKWGWVAGGGASLPPCSVLSLTPLTWKYEFAWAWVWEQITFYWWWCMTMAEAMREMNDILFLLQKDWTFHRCTAHRSCRAVRRWNQPDCGISG